MIISIIIRSSVTINQLEVNIVKAPEKYTNNGKGVKQDMTLDLVKRGQSIKIVNIPREIDGPPDRPAAAAAPQEVGTPMMEDITKSSTIPNCILFYFAAEVW